MGRGHWSLISATTATNFELETDKVVVTRCPISVEFSRSLELHCLENKGSSRSKNKHKLIVVSEAIDDSRLWNDSCIYGL